MSALKFFFSLITFSVCVSLFAQPIAHGHAHNDYLHEKPLLDALVNGFTSIEADIFLYKKQLLVAHTAKQLDTKKTLEELYLRPIDSLIQLNRANGNTSDSTRLILMIDIKSSGDEVYSYLNELLQKYKHVLTPYRKAKALHWAPVQILLSGNKPNVKMLEDTTLFTFDEDIDYRNDATVLPYTTRFSSAWGNYFKWKGKGKMSKPEEERLKSLVTQVHRLKKEIRFYHIPDNAAVWDVLLKNNVDWVNTDNLILYRQFYLDFIQKNSNK
ncbi:MAG: hypothetical protein KA242_01790 [Chitinophagales bacterium]|nr:hypothetical protein [Chitinophagales bacterium]